MPERLVDDVDMTTSSSLGCGWLRMPSISQDHGSPPSVRLPGSRVRELIRKCMLLASGCIKGARTGGSKLYFEMARKYQNDPI